VALPDLIAALEHEAEQRAAAIRNDAEAEAQAIVAAAEARCAAQQQQAVRAFERLFQADAQRQLIEARRAARARWLAARSALLERVRSAVQAELAGTLTTPAYRAHLYAALERAWPYVEGAVVIRCSPAIETLVRSLTAARPAVTVTPDAALGHGFCMQAGALEIGGTLEDDVAAAWPHIAIEIMRAIGDPA
jgi:vacuolar-type H+-ATPase subunit E/Vma4